MSKPTVNKPPVPTFNPYGVIYTVVMELTNEKVKKVFTGAEFAAALPHAAALLRALGVVPVLPVDEEAGR